MSEKIKPTSSDSEQVSDTLRFPDDPNQYSEEELRADPAKRYRVNPADFPIFAQQAEMGDKRGDTAKTLPLDMTLGRFVKNTADCIAVIAGEDASPESQRVPAADHVIYLDKSARPVSWLNNVFWDAFTDKPRPSHSYLAIDRRWWFKRVGVEIDNNEYVKDNNGETSHLATFSDFMGANPVSEEDIARIRALFIPGGIKSEDIEEIMKTPTSLDGKNITIIDEVSRSGSTLDIAKYLISRAIPEATSVNGYTFWDTGFQRDGNEKQMRSLPVWYDRYSSIGRGIADIDEKYFAERYERYPNPKTRAQKFGSIALGAYTDLSIELHNKSRQLAKEIKNMRKEWDDGHILMLYPDRYSKDKWRSRLESQGVQFIPPQPKMPKNALLEVKKDLESRPPVRR